MRRLLAISLILVLLVAISPGCSCSCIKDKVEQLKPKVNIKTISIEEVSYARITVEVGGEIENPNPIGATLDRIAYDIYFGHDGKWMLLGHGERGKLEIESNATTDFSVTTVIENKQMLKALLEFMFGSEVSQVKVDGNAWLKVGPTSFKIPFEKAIIDPK